MFIIESKGERGYWSCSLGWVFEARYATKYERTFHPIGLTVGDAEFVNPNTAIDYEDE